MEYEIGQRVEAYFGGRWLPATVRGIIEKANWIIVQSDSGKWEAHPMKGDVIRLLPTPQPPFAVGDEVEVLSAKGDKVQCVVCYFVGDDVWVEGVGVGYGAWIDWKKEPHRIRPYVAPKTKRVPLEAGELLGKWVRNQSGAVALATGWDGQEVWSGGNGRFKPCHAMGKAWEWSDLPAGPWNPCYKEVEVSNV